jgi:hypothetical protein
MVAQKIHQSITKQTKKGKKKCKHHLKNL